MKQYMLIQRFGVWSVISYEHQPRTKSFIKVNGYNYKLHLISDLAHCSIELLKAKINQHFWRYNTPWYAILYSSKLSIPLDEAKSTPYNQCKQEASFLQRKLDRLYDKYPEYSI